MARCIPEDEGRPQLGSRGQGVGTRASLELGGNRVHHRDEFRFTGDGRYFGSRLSKAGCHERPQTLMHCGADPQKGRNQVINEISLASGAVFLNADAEGGNDEVLFA